MKHLIKEYLLSLKERGELDKLLPEILVERGYSLKYTPKIGGRQHGVDIFATKGGKIYLFVIKSGNLDRKDWDTSSPQSVRPSLNEITDSFININLTDDERNQKIIICLCIGGEVADTVRTAYTQYKNNIKRKYGNINFEDWDGDRVADELLKSMLREQAMPEVIKVNFRKAIAFVDEPSVSIKFFTKLSRQLVDASKDKKNRMRSCRQIAICLHILSTFCEEAGNLESAYISSEVALLNLWHVYINFTKTRDEKNKIFQIFLFVLGTYERISQQLLIDKILNVAGYKYSISSSVGTRSFLDVNLRLFDIFGRISAYLIWQYSFLSYLLSNNTIDDEEFNNKIEHLQIFLKQTFVLIDNNPALLTPSLDEHIVDISLFLIANIYINGKSFDSQMYLKKLVEGIFVSYSTHKSFPTILRDYKEMTELDIHSCDEERFKEITKSSTFHSYLAIFAAYFDRKDIFDYLASLQVNLLNHCNFQMWSADEETEKMLFFSGIEEGACITGIQFKNGIDGFVEDLKKVMPHTTDLSKLETFKSMAWVILLTACRFYRKPIPLQFMWEFIREHNSEQE